MVFKKFVTPLLITGLLLTVTASFADQFDMGKVSGRIGVFMPSNSAAKDDFGSSWLDLQLGYKVASTPKADSIVECGWIGSSKSVDGVDLKFHMIPLTYTYKMKSPSNPKFYYGGGGGLYFCKASVGSSGFDFSSDTETKLGIHGFAGVSMTDTLGAELRYTKLLDTSDFDGFSLDISGRF